MAEHFPATGRGGADPDDNNAHEADRKSKKRRKAHKKAEKLRQELEALTAEERAGLARDAAVSGISAREVEFEGRKVHISAELAALSPWSHFIGTSLHDVTRLCDSCNATAYTAVQGNSYSMHCSSDSLHLDPKLPCLDAAARQHGFTHVTA